MKQGKTQSQILQFRLSVKNISPEIWRTFLVSSDVTLARLHSILQVLMGWRDNHLYAFVINDKRYYPAFKDDDEGDKKSSVLTKLSSIFTKNTTLITYEYDFSDGWKIELCSEQINNDFHQNQTVECIEGSRHGPVEDSGGARGYMEKAKIYGNPNHKRYLEVRKLIGPNFDPEAFDLVRTNEMLKEIV
jgi:hypothetical protein